MNAVSGSWRRRRDASRSTALNHAGTHVSSARAADSPTCRSGAALSVHDRAREPAPRRIRAALRPARAEDAGECARHVPALRDRKSQLRHTLSAASSRWWPSVRALISQPASYARPSRSSLVAPAGAPGGETDAADQCGAARCSSQSRTIQQSLSSPIGVHSRERPARPLGHERRVLANDLLTARIHGLDGAIAIGDDADAARRTTHRRSREGAAMSRASDDLVETAQRYLPAARADVDAPRDLSFVVDRRRGSHLIDTHGRRYSDYAARVGPAPARPRGIPRLRRP